MTLELASSYPSWSGSVNRKLTVSDSFDGSGDLLVNVESHGQDIDFWLDNQTARQLVNHLNTVLANDDDSFVAPEPGGQETITFRGQQYEVLGVETDTNFEEVHSGWNARLFPVSESMTLSIRPVQPKPKPGEFKHGDVIRRNDRISTGRFKVYEVDDNWYYRYPETKRMVLITDRNQWVKAD